MASNLRPQEIQARSTDAIFCEAIANGHSITNAGRIVGLTQGPASRKFKRICREMGWQAQ